MHTCIFPSLVLGLTENIELEAADFLSQFTQHRGHALCCHSCVAALFLDIDECREIPGVCENGVCKTAIDATLKQNTVELGEKGHQIIKKSLLTVTDMKKRQREV